MVVLPAAAASQGMSGRRSAIGPVAAPPWFVTWNSTRRSSPRIMPAARKPGVTASSPTSGATVTGSVTSARTPSALVTSNTTLPEVRRRSVASTV